MSPSVVAEPAEVVLNGVAPQETDGTIAKRGHYAPPWADVSIIGIAGSSGSGKSTLSQAIVNKLNLPWVVILSIVSRRPRRDKVGRFGPRDLFIDGGSVGLVLQEPGCRVLKESLPQRVRL